MGNRIIKAREKKQINLDLSKYVNSDTGELLTSELNKDKMIVSVTQEGNYVVITSDDYVVLDCKTVNYLSAVLSKPELQSIVLMATDLKTPLNIVYNGPQPHSNDTLQRFLGYSSQAMFLKLLKKLIKEGVIYQIKGKISGEIRVIYMMNPFLARKRKTIDKGVFNVFNPFL